MGTKISGLCGNKESLGNGEFSLSTKTEKTEEVIKAKSAKKIQSKWKKLNITKLNKIKHFDETKRRLDQLSGDKIVNHDFMRKKINPSVIQFEINILPFTKKPEILLQINCFERDPIELDDGSVYHGHWNENGQRQGYGVLVRNDGSKYEGFFEKDNINGRGRYIESKGSFYYEGNIVIFYRNME